MNVIIPVFFTLQLFFCAIPAFKKYFPPRYAYFSLTKSIQLLIFIKPSRCEIRFVLCYGPAREVNPHVYNSLTFVAVSHFQTFFVLPISPFPKCVALLPPEFIRFDFLLIRYS